VPTILRHRGYRFYFYSSDADEPPHVHVDHSGRTINVWLETLKIAYNDGYPMRTVTVVLDLVDRNRDQLLEAWREYFDD
jgi:hypothetical protein